MRLILEYMQGKGYYISNLPKNYVTLFLARLPESGFLAIFGPKKKCINDSKDIDLFDAKVGFASEVGDLMLIGEVKNGCKYTKGGGWVEFGCDCPHLRNKVTFQLPSSNEKNTYNMQTIKEVFIVY